MSATRFHQTLAEKSDLSLSLSKAAQRWRSWIIDLARTLSIH